MVDSEPEEKNRRAIMAHLKSRASDIDACFDAATVPLRGRFARTFMAGADRPVYIPTYNALKYVHRARVTSDLVASGLIDSEQKAAYDENRHKYDVLSRLALSYAPGAHIYKLAQSGFGIWPVGAGISLGDIDFRKLGVTIDKGIDTVKSLGINIHAREIGGVWFNGNDLTSSKPSVSVEELASVNDYLPRISEALAGIAEYHDQEDRFPTTKGRWIKTGSALALPTSEFFQPRYTIESPMEILMDCCTEFTPNAALIRQLLSSGQDFRSKRFPDNLTIAKSGRNIIIVQEAETIYRRTERELFYVNKNGESVTLGNGFLEIAKPKDNPTLTVPLNSLLEEIIRNKELVAKAMQAPVLAPIVLKVMRDRGVQLGVDFNPKNVTLADETVNQHLQRITIYISWFERKATETASQKLALPIADKVYWPNIIPDPYAARYAI